MNWQQGIWICDRSGVKLGQVVVRDSIIMRDSVIGENTIINKSILRKL